MEIKYAHEMASIAEATRVAKCAKDTVSARTYLEENLMKDIEAVAEKGGNYMSHFINIKDEDVKKALKNLCEIMAIKLLAQTVFLKYGGK